MSASTCAEGVPLRHCSSCDSSSGVALHPDALSDNSATSEDTAVSCASTACADGMLLRHCSSCDDSSSGVALHPDALRDADGLSSRPRSAWHADGDSLATFNESMQISGMPTPQPLGRGGESIERGGSSGRIAGEVNDAVRGTPASSRARDGGSACSCVGAIPGEGSGGTPFPARAGKLIPRYPAPPVFSSYAFEVPSCANTRRAAMHVNAGCAGTPSTRSDGAELVAATALARPNQTAGPAPATGTGAVAAPIASALATARPAPPAASVCATAAEAMLCGIRRDCLRPVRSSPLACAQRSFSAPSTYSAQFDAWLLTEDSASQGDTDSASKPSRSDSRRASEPNVRLASQLEQATRRGHTAATQPSASMAGVGAPPSEASGPVDDRAEPPPPMRSISGQATVGPAVDWNGNSALAVKRLMRTATVLREQMNGRNWHTGAMVSVRMEGDVQLDLAVGEARAGMAITERSMFNWMSTTKAVAVVAIAQMLEQKRLHISDRVCKFVPEFGVYGKELITIEHLLVHTAGIPYADVSMWSKLHLWDEVLEAICESKIEEGMSPGSKAAYHPYSAWFVLGEIIRRIDGRRFDIYAREEIFVPLEMHDCYVGMPREAYGRYHAEGRFVELRTMSPKGKLQKNTTLGTAPDEVTACVPGSNGRGPAPQWLLLFECLMRGGVGRNGRRLLLPETVARITTRHRVGMYDVVQGIICDWSLGLFVKTGDGPQISGAHSTHNTYGHGGSQSSVGFVDPGKGLAVVIVCNTRPGVKHHYERMMEISTAIYEDLGLCKGAVAIASLDAPSSSVATAPPTNPAPFVAPSTAAFAASAPCARVVIPAGPEANAAAAASGVSHLAAAARTLAGSTPVARGTPIGGQPSL